jgi:hypothetical protein
LVSATFKVCVGKSTCTILSLNIMVSTIDTTLDIYVAIGIGDMPRTLNWKNWSLFTYWN